MSREQDLVEMFGHRRHDLEALGSLCGGVTTTHLRRLQLAEPAYDAAVEGLSNPNPRIRWWCAQVLDHVAEPRAVAALAPALDDPVPRVRRVAAHALSCAACKPGWSAQLPPSLVRKLQQMADQDANPKVRLEATRALARHAG